MNPPNKQHLIQLNPKFLTKKQVKEQNLNKKTQVKHLRTIWILSYQNQIDTHRLKEKEKHQWIDQLFKF